MSHQILKMILKILKSYLIEQICSTVRWRESIINMSKEKILQNLLKLALEKFYLEWLKEQLKNINCFSINSIDDIKKQFDEFKNKNIILTGATGIIGNSLVKKFTDQGSNIFATGTKEEKLKILKNKFNKYI